MAFKRRKARRASARRSSGFFTKKRRSSNGSSGAPLTGLIIGGMAYGATREKISNMLAPITAKLPMGNIADEVVLGVGAYFLAKNTNGVMRDYARAALTVESARLGEALINGELNLTGAANATKATNSGVFG